MIENQKTIFVAIGAYNEPFLEQTILNCIEMASYPDRLRFGVWSHNSDGVVPNFSHIPNVKLITAQFPTLLGVGAARTGALFLYNNEDYYLQIDAHMLFQRNWDEIVINHYKNIQQKHPKPILTTYVPWWATEEDGEIILYSPDSDAPAMPMRFVDDGESQIPMQETFWIDWDEHQYYEHHGLSAHFIFTSSSFVYDVLPDIELMFYGEEPTTAMRAWTRGYRIFTVKDPIVWHYNKGYGNLYKFDRHVTVVDSKLHAELFEVKQKRAHIKTREILLGNLTGYWGAPSKEILTEYHHASGFNFIDFYNKNSNRLT